MSHLTGFAIQPNKAVVGANAFAHECGIHQDGVIKNPLTYEIMTPQSVGLSGSQLTIGKLSGRKGLQKKLRDLGHDVSGDALDVIYREAIALADLKKEVTDADLLALAQQRSDDVPASIVLDGWSVTSSHGGRSTGSVRVTLDGEERAGEETGNGPVNALYRAVDDAIRPVLGWEPTLVEYEIKAITEGEDAQGRVFIRCRRSIDVGPEALVVTGHGLSTNIIEASLEAYVVAANKLRAAELDGTVIPMRRSVEQPAVTAEGDLPGRRSRAPGGPPGRPTASSRSRATASGPTSSRRRSASSPPPARASASRSRGRTSSSAARRSTRTASPSATRTSPPAPPATRSCSAPWAARSGTTRRRRFAPSRRSSRCAAASACSPTCAR